MIEMGFIVDHTGTMFIVVSEGGRLKCFEIVGMNDNGNWLVI